MGKRLTADYLRQADLSMEQLDFLVRGMLSSSVLQDYIWALDRAKADYRRALVTAHAAYREAAAGGEMLDRESAVRAHRAHKRARDEAEATYRNAVTTAVWAALELEENRGEVSP